MKIFKNGNLMANLSKLSKAFMLPIALLPIAGLFLGIGSSLVGNVKEASGIWWIGKVMAITGNIPFANLPALFAISIAIAYTKNSGVAGLTAFIGWLVFNAFISVFVTPSEQIWDIKADFELNRSRFPDYGSGLLNVTNQKFTDYTFTMDNHGYIPPFETVASRAGGWIEPQVGMKQALASDLSAKLNTSILASDINIFNPTSILKSSEKFNLLFWRGDIAVDNSIITPILGIGSAGVGMGPIGGSLNTGVFGGIIVGSLVAFIFNKFHTVKLPNVISFFGGVRAVPIITFILMLPLALLTMFIWPGFGVLLNSFGKWTGTLPGGVDSLVFGVAKRALIPFGLHHVFYAPLWWSGAGGQLSSVITSDMVQNASTLTAQGDQSMMMAILADGKLKIQDVWDAGLHVGRFQSGEFAMMMFALPAIAVVMWLTVPKENRRVAMGIYFGAAITSFLTGITEPLEFTFLFVAPALYYLVHVPIFATSYLLANVTGIKIGMTFSGGLLDWIIFGIIPTLNQHNTRFWLVPIEGLGYAAVEGTLFYFLLKKFKWAIPGMKDQPVKLFSKSDYRNKNGDAVPGGERTLAIIEGLGGQDNLDNVDACATRLRVSVKDTALVNAEMLKSLGAVAVVKSGKGIQAIFGGESDIIKTNINTYLESKTDQKQSTVMKGAI